MKRRRRRPFQRPGAAAALLRWRGKNGGVEAGERIVGELVRFWRLIIFLAPPLFLVGVLAGSWVPVAASLPVAGVGLLFFRVHVSFSDGIIVVQNFVRRHEIPIRDVAYFEVMGGGFERTPRFVLRNGRRVPVLACSRRQWRYGRGPNDLNANRLAAALGVPDRAPDGPTFWNWTRGTRRRS